MARWHVKDIILVTILAIFMGVIFWVTGPLYTVFRCGSSPVRPATHG
jgi:ABC-type cobalt transport system, permease component.